MSSDSQPPSWSLRHVRGEERDLDRQEDRSAGSSSHLGQRQRQRATARKSRVVMTKVPVTATP